MGKKKQNSVTSSTPAEAAAGAANLAAYLESSTAPPALKHGIRALMTTGKIPESIPGATEIRERITTLIDATAVDLGGPDQVTGSQRAILESQRVALTVVALGSRYLEREGLMNRRGKVHGLLGVLVSYANVIRLNSLALGLERRAKDIHTLDSITREYADAAKATKAPADV